MRLIVAVLLAAAAAGCAGNVRFPGPTSDAKTLTGSLFRPNGAGSFPAVVLLHTCGGITFEPDWAKWLAAEGYVALLVDSFRARGVMNTCSSGSAGPSTSAVAMDALAALDHLQSLEVVARDRIAVMGWSY